MSAQAGGLEGGCERVGLALIAELPVPSVVVLGERKGTQPDLHRAMSVVRSLSRDEVPVTLALQAVDESKQPVLDKYAAGGMDPEDLPGLLSWSKFWGFPFGPYESLVTASLEGATVKAIGGPYVGRPVDAEVPSAPGYLEVLYDGMAGYPMPPASESPFTRFVSYQDQLLAKRALAAWDGQGVLVILADRIHVEGGKGISFQAQLLTEVPVTAIVLAAGETCFPLDKVWR